MAKKVTVNDIASYLGVSRATVSRALNGADGVGAELREQILQYASEVNYQYKSTAVQQNKEVSDQRLKVIGLVYSDVRNPFYTELTYYIQQELFHHGYTVMILNNEDQSDREMEFLHLARSYQLSGLLLLTTQIDIDSFRDQVEDLPVVFVNRIPKLPNFDSVTLDNFDAGYQAAMHLINHGHQKVGFITGPEASSASMKRVEGFRQAMNNSYLPIDPSFVMEGNLKMQGGYDLAEQIMARENRPTALIFGNDLMAIGFMNWCKEHDFSIPQDMSMIGFDDIEFSGLQGIQLTSISQHVEEMGRNAAQLILKRIQQPESAYQRIILRPELKARNSTAEYTAD